MSDDKGAETFYDTIRKTRQSSVEYRGLLNNFHEPDVVRDCKAGSSSRVK